MEIPELKAVLLERGVDTNNCVEKSDFIALVLKTIPSEEPSTSEKPAEKEENGKGDEKQQGPHDLEVLSIQTKGARALSDCDYRKAKTYFEKAISLSPNDPSSYYNLGAALANSNEPRLAFHNFVRAAEISRSQFSVDPKAKGLWSKSVCKVNDIVSMIKDLQTPLWLHSAHLRELSRDVLACSPREEPDAFFGACTFRVSILLPPKNDQERREINDLIQTCERLAANPMQKMSVHFLRNALKGLSLDDCLGHVPENVKRQMNMPDDNYRAQTRK